MGEASAAGLQSLIEPVNKPRHVMGVDPMAKYASNLAVSLPAPPGPEPTGPGRVVAPVVLGQPDPDKIAEVHVQLGGAATAEQRARARIDWMAAKAKGPCVLDLACGRGTLAILLARHGHEVIGVDLDSAAVGYARNLVQAEPPATRDRVRLVVGDALSVDLPMSAYDTVVLGELNEHLPHPSSIIERAASLLKTGGRLVLTTAFGYRPHPDHDQELRTSELARSLTSRFVVHELTVVDGYFRVVARVAPWEDAHRRRRPDSRQLLITTEEAAVAEQKYLYGLLADARRELAENKRQLAQKERLLEAQEQRHTRLLEAHLQRHKRIIAAVQARMEQAQTSLKQEQRSLRSELGRAVEKSFGSPLGIFRLPQRLAKAYRRARRHAETGQWTPGGSSTRAVPRGARSEGPPLARVHRDISHDFPPYAFPEFAPRSCVKVATVLDEFSDACFRYEAHLTRVTKDGWQAQIEQARPALLLVESAWKGNRGHWRGLITEANQTPDNPLDALVGYCRRQGIPTVFWNKEDPPNFERFIDAAAKFDFVFTTDANCIDRYRALLHHPRVLALPFAAQPAIHNPIGKQESDEYEIAFAGTWYAQKHVERGALLPIVLDAAMGRGLHIFDRMSDHTRNDCFTFPEKYAPYLRAALPYANVLSTYRNFKLFLNVNSVTDSPTMFARRVFEILASSTAVVSTASTGIEHMLAEVVSVVQDEKEARSEIEKLLDDPAYRRRKAHAGYRKVMQEHTYTQRFRTIARTIGLDLDEVRDQPLVSVVTTLDDPGLLDHALANLRRQTYPRCHPVWVLRGDHQAGPAAARIVREWPNATVVELGTDASMPAMVQAGIEAARGAYVTVFGPRDLYGAEFITDLVLAFTYADADIVGKAACFGAAPPGEALELNLPSLQYRHVAEVAATAWLARRKLFDRVGIDHLLGCRDGVPVVTCANGFGRIYSSDPFNYLRAPAELAAATKIVAASRDHDAGGLACAHIMI